MKDKVKWKIGDWLNDRKDKYSRNRYEEVLADSHYKYGTLANIASVCAKVKRSCRNENLSFEHHVAVASLSPEKQAYWLDKAENPPDYISGHWSARELRKRISNARLLAEKNEPEKETGNEYYVVIGTRDNAYSYLEYIDQCNISAKSLIRNIRRLNEFKNYAAWREKVRSEQCVTANEKNFVKSCSRLFWELEFLLNEHLSKLTVLSEDGLIHRPLLYEDVCKDYPSFELIGAILEAQPWKNQQELSDVPEFYQYECLFAVCRRLAVMLNKEVRDLTKNFDKFYQTYDEPPLDENYCSSEEHTKYLADEFIKEHVDAFRLTCYALIIHLLDLFKVINSYVPEPPDKETVEKMNAKLFDSGTEGEEKKSKVDSKVKELLKIIFEDSGK